MSDTAGVEVVACGVQAVPTLASLTWDGMRQVCARLHHAPGKLALIQTL